MNWFWTNLDWKLEDFLTIRAAKFQYGLPSQGIHIALKWNLKSSWKGSMTKQRRGVRLIIFACETQIQVLQSLYWHWEAPPLFKWCLVFPYFKVFTSQLQELGGDYTPDPYSHKCFIGFCVSVRCCCCWFLLQPLPVPLKHWVLVTANDDGFDWCSYLYLQSSQVPDRSVFLFCLWSSWSPGLVSGRNSASQMDTDWSAFIFLCSMGHGILSGVLWAPIYQLLFCCCSSGALAVPFYPMLFICDTQ